MGITEDLKRLGIPESELRAAWNADYPMDPYIMSEEMRFQDGAGNVKTVFVEALTYDELIPDDGELEDSFPNWDHYTIHAGIDVASAVKTPEVKPPILMFGGGASLNLEGGDVSFQECDEPPAPPKVAMFLVFLLPKAQREFVVGDIVEQYAAHKAEYGALGAYFWVYAQVLISLWPLLREVGIVALIGELIRRFTK